jgi:hypothetical protein
MDDERCPSYYAASRSYRDFMVVRPNDSPPDLGVSVSEDESEAIGIAYPTGWRPYDDDCGRAAEVTWRLVVHHAEIPGRFVLRRGAFVPVD